MLDDISKPKHAMFGECFTGMCRHPLYPRLLMFVRILRRCVRHAMARDQIAEIRQQTLLTIGLHVLEIDFVQFQQ
jgi:hypothetical protein